MDGLICELSLPVATRVAFFYSIISVIFYVFFNEMCEKKEEELMSCDYWKLVHRVDIFSGYGFPNCVAF